MAHMHVALFRKFDPNYKEMDTKIDHSRTPLIVCNHLGLMDGHIAWANGFGPAILAKKSWQDILWLFLPLLSKLRNVPLCQY